MTTEPYVPTVEVVLDSVSFPRERLGEPRPISPEAFERFVAKIRADALREAARDMRAQVERATEHQRFTEHELIEGGVEHVLNEYAERIEEEA